MVIAFTESRFQQLIILLEEMDQHGRRIVVLGANGMLGRMVCLWFRSRGWLVESITARFDLEVSQREAFLSEALQWEDSVIVNCIGQIPQTQPSTESYFWANSVLPLSLRARLRETQILVHASTDCVFSGSLDPLEMYKKEDKPDETHPYGWSKRLGEVALLGSTNCLCIRVSIIGIRPGLEKPRGLLDWFLSQPAGAVLNGFEDHWWNGITVLEWCKQVELLLACSTKSGFIHLGTKQVHTKADMLRMFAKVFSRDIGVVGTKTGNPLNKCLEPDIVCSALDIQLEELKEFEKL